MIVRFSGVPGNQILGSKGLKFDAVRTRSLGGVHQTARQVKAAIVIHARFGDDIYAHRYFLSKILPGFPTTVQSAGTIPNDDAARADDGIAPDSDALHDHGSRPYMGV